MPWVKKISGSFIPTVYLNDGPAAIDDQNLVFKPCGAWTIQNKAPKAPGSPKYSACGALSPKTGCRFWSTKFSPKSFWSTNFRDTPHPYPPHWISGYIFFLRNLVDQTPMIEVYLGSKRELFWL